MVADPATLNWEDFFGPEKMDTEFAGGIWTDKSVFTDVPTLLLVLALLPMKVNTIL